MTNIQYYLDGVPLLLGKKIGRGGEGEVYLASNYPGTAVKIYTDHKNTQRESKVSSMVKYKLADKTSLVSFPKGVIKTKAGVFVGFAMNLVAEHRPLHQAYGPKSLKIHFPNADFRFLIRVATNIARAVGQVHQSPCVIGDINESGILVSKDATVAIIDADSFQFEAGEKHFPCLVGVPSFTPPELQGKSLKGVIRIKHHDYFGLAIAIFQLLFMGRHPYAGRQHPDQNLSLEQAIAKNLFAYSCLRKTQMTPPPFVLTLNDFPLDIANAFERAFGINHLSRPGPSEWVEILKQLESQLSRCTENPIHYYPSNGKSCPWCRIELLSGARLFAPPTMASTAHTIYSNCSIDTMWADIESISIPQINTIQPTLTISPAVSPSPDAQNCLSSMQGKKIFLALGAIAAATACFYVPTLFIVWLIIIIFSISHFFDMSINKNEWIERYKKADNTFCEALSAWQQRSGVTKLYEIRSSLENAANEFRSFPALRAQALRQFMLDHLNNQLANYLDRYLLNNASIPGIGPSKKVVLASFGIESAADIKQSEILKIPGFGQVTTEKLLEWRAGIENKFVYNSKVSSTDIEAKAKIENEFNRKANILLKVLSSGATELRQTLIQVQARAKNSDHNLNQLASARAQLEVDLKFLGIAKPACTFKQTVSLITGSKTTTNQPQRSTISVTNPIKCYKCGSLMVRRTARRGRNIGNSFWGCSAYPRCRATKP